MDKIAIIGAGLMGHGIAQIFAVKGYTITLVDLDEQVLEHALTGVRSNLALMAENGLGSVDEINAVLERISVTTNMALGVDGADLVFEAVVENLSVKQKIFKELDRLCPLTTILASNTSVISITEIAKNAEHRQRIVGTHFWNPPHLIPLVEVIPGADTSSATVDKAFRILADVGKHPVKVKKDVPGFVGNRLQHALWREAVSIVDQGIADAATVDECVKYGFGMRLPALGPMENADMVGTDLTLAIHDYILEHIEDSHTPAPLLKSLVEKGNLGFKSGKGFQEWTQDQAKQRRQDLAQFLLDKMKP